MIVLSSRNQIRCIACLCLSIAAASAAAGEEEQEIRYLFAGMLQERGKLKSWSCEIKGMDAENSSFELKLLSNGECVRFSRRQHLPGGDAAVYPASDGKGKKPSVRKPFKFTHLPKRDKVVHACDNRKETVAWNVSDRECSILKSNPLQRQTLHLWDPRTAGLIIDPEDTDYQKALNRRLEAWRASIKVERKGALRTVMFTKPYEWQDVRLSLTIDTEHGFTPVLYRGDTLYKPNSNFPGKTEAYYQATAKWRQIDGVWVPIHHRHVKGDGTLVREYNISWDWINKDVDDKEFTIDALKVPNDVRKVHIDEKGNAISKNFSIPVGKAAKPPPIRRPSRPWLKWLGLSLGFALIAVALLIHRLRKKPNNPAG